MNIEYGRLRVISLFGVTLLSSALLAAIAIASAIFGSVYSIYFRTPFPYRDMVETMEFLDGNPSIWLGATFSELHDMEHRTALPAIVWYVDRITSGSSGLMPLLLSHAMLAAVAIFAISNWAPRISVKAPLTWLMPPAALAMMFSLTNWYDLVWEKQLHMSMSCLAPLFRTSDLAIH